MLGRLLALMDRPVVSAGLLAALVMGCGRLGYESVDALGADGTLGPLTVDGVGLINADAGVRPAGGASAMSSVPTANGSGGAAQPMIDSTAEIPTGSDPSNPVPAIGSELGAGGQTSVMQGQAGSSAGQDPDLTGTAGAGGSLGSDAEATGGAGGSGAVGEDGSGGDGGVGGADGLGGSGGLSASGGAGSVGSGGSGGQNSGSSSAGACELSGNETVVSHFDSPGTSGIAVSGDGDPMLGWTDAVGNPSLGALDFSNSLGGTAALQSAPAGDFSGRVMTVNVLLDAGSDMSIRLSARGRQGLLTQGELIVPGVGEWYCVRLDFDNPAFAEPGFDATRLTLLELEISGNGPLRVYVDQVAY